MMLSINSIVVTVVLLACLVLVGCARHINDPGRDISVPDTGHAVLTNHRSSPPDWPQALYAGVYIP